MWQLNKCNAKSHRKYARIDTNAPEIHVATPVFIGIPTDVSICITHPQPMQAMCTCTAASGGALYSVISLPGKLIILIASWVLMLRVDCFTVSVKT